MFKDRKQSQDHLFVFASALTASLTLASLTSTIQSARIASNRIWANDSLSMTEKLAEQRLNVAPAVAAEFPTETNIPKSITIAKLERIDSTRQMSGFVMRPHARSGVLNRKSTKDLLARVAKVVVVAPSTVVPTVSGKEGMTEEKTLELAYRTLQKNFYMSIQFDEGLNTQHFAELDAKPAPARVALAGVVRSIPKARVYSSKVSASSSSTVTPIISVSKLDTQKKIENVDVARATAQALSVSVNRSSALNDHSITPEKPEATLAQAEPADELSSHTPAPASIAAVIRTDRIAATVAAPSRAEKPTDDPVVNTNDAISAGKKYSLVGPVGPVTTQNNNGLSCESVKVLGSQTPAKILSKKTIARDGYSSEYSPEYSQWVEYHPDGLLPIVQFEHRTRACRTSAQIEGLSENDLQLLSRMASTKPIAGLGHILGRVPAGWRVSFSGRSDRPLYLASDLSRNLLERRTEDEKKDERVFFIPNVAPGAHIIYLVNDQGVHVGGGLIVLAGRETYIQFSVPNEKTYTQRVSNGESQTQKGLVGASVEIIGQSPARYGISSQTGKVDIRYLSLNGDLPQYVDVRARDQGIRFRYRLRESNQEAGQLLAFSKDRLEAWIGQLPGGNSPGAGMALLSVAKLPINDIDQGLSAAVKLFSGEANQEFVPEAYILDQMGRLIPKVEFTESNRAAVIVQIPEGPAVIEVESNEQENIWSELIISQPFVVNVLGM